MLTHETAHALLHQRWRPNPDASYREQLRFICFDEGFAHLLACGKELASFDPSGWIEEHQAHALEQLRQALVCKDGSEQEQWLAVPGTNRTLLGKVCGDCRQAVSDAASGCVG